MRKYVLKNWLNSALCRLNSFWSHSRSVILLLVVGLLLNVIPAKLAIFFGLPLYLDCTGTVLTAMLGGYLPAIIVGFSLNAINGISDPVTTYYGVLSILIAIFAAFFFHKNFFKNAWRILVVIFSFAIIGGGLGSIFTYFLFGLNLGEGASAPFAVAFHDVMGFGLFTSQFLADIVVDVFDKTIIVVLAVFIFHFISQNYKDQMNRIFMRKTGTGRGFSNSMVSNSLLSKVIIMMIITEVLLGTLASAIGFFLYREKTIRSFTEIAYGAAQAATVAVDVEKLDEYIAKGYEAEGYARTKWVLERIRESFPQTKFLYVYKFLPDGVVVIFDLDSDDYPGEPPGKKITFDPAYKAYLPNLLAGEEIEPIISNDIYGWLFMVYKPLKNAAGKTVAYVGVDIAMETIKTDEAVFFIKLLSLFFGLSILIMCVVVELVKRRVVAPLNNMSQAVFRIATNTMIASEFEDGEMDLGRIKMSVDKLVGLDILNHDEIGKLYEDVCTMSRDTYNFMWKVQEQGKRIQRMQEVIIMEFAEMVEARDKCTGDHIKKTAEYVEAVARELQVEGKFKGVLTDAYVNKLKRAAPLHDIGKIAVSDLILNKNGKLTDDEYAIMKSHTTEGGKILQKIVDDAKGAFDPDYLTESIEMAKYHHEKWDGTGYPERLKGENIPLSARIMAVADVFDALIAERIYKKGFSYEKAMAIITEGAGKHFDPDVVEAFTHISRKLYDERTKISQTESGESGEKEPEIAVKAG